MNVNFFQEDNGSLHLSEDTLLGRKPVKKYGFIKFIVDCCLVFVTGGLWLIWIFVREMRRR